MAGYGLSQDDHDRLQRMLLWFDRIGKTLLPNMFRRNPVLAVGGGETIVWATCVRSLSYDDPPTTGISTYLVRPAKSKTEPWSAQGHSFGDVVSYDSGTATTAGQNRSYTCIQAPGNNPPSEGADNNQWTLGGADEVEINRALGHDAYSSASEKDLRNWLPWIPPGAVVAIIQYDGSWYLSSGLFFAGTESTSSLRWNKTDERVMAVWR